jgi:hypothetical protein
MDPRQIIDYANDGDANEFRNALYASIHDKVSAHLELAKQNMAKTMLTREEVEQIDEKKGEEVSVTNNGHSLKHVRLGTKFKYTDGSEGQNVSHKGKHIGHVYKDAQNPTKSCWVSHCKRLDYGSDTMDSKEDAVKDLVDLHHGR